MPNFKNLCQKDLKYFSKMSNPHYNEKHIQRNAIKGPNKYYS